MSQKDFIALSDIFTKFFKKITKASSSLTIFLNYNRALAIDSLIRDSNCLFVI